MALTKDIILSSGINLPNSYIRIKKVELYNGLFIDIHIEIYKDKNARDDNKSPVSEFTHRCTDKYYDYFHLDILNQENVNIISQSYIFLKENISFYESAIDVMDVKE